MRLLMVSRPTVLVVEDNPDLRRLYAIGLNRHGYKVKLASNGAEALDRVEHERPDVILLDIVMPVMSGLELLEKISGRDDVPSIPVVVITGHSQNDEARAHPAVAAWLVKPVTIHELIEAINAQIGQAPAEDRNH